MEVLSVAVVACSFVGAGILAFRKYSSITGALFLAAMGTIGGECTLESDVYIFLNLNGSWSEMIVDTKPWVKLTQLGI